MYPINHAYIVVTLGNDSRGGGSRYGNEVCSKTKKPYFKIGFLVYISLHPHLRPRPLHQKSLKRHPHLHLRLRPHFQS